MIPSKKFFGIALLSTLLMAAVAGCDRQEGPAEQAGKSLDQTTQKAGEKIEEAGDSIQDAVSDGRQ